MEHLNLPVDLRFRCCVGAGGIGSGLFFFADGEHTLGREESRSGHFLDRRDYCKLHIVTHYLKRLMGPRFSVIPIGAVGADAAGHQLLSEMRSAGLEMRHVRTLEEYPTLFSVCITYPDRSGGNLTENASASAQVTPDQILDGKTDVCSWGGRGMVLALPEAPLSARLALLELGSESGSLRVAAFTSQELRGLSDPFDRVDLLALNLDEAAMLARRRADAVEPSDIVHAVVDRAAAAAPGMMLTITAGAVGSWAWDGREVHYCRALDVQPVSTAGAGDAHLAGVLAGLAAGLQLPEAHVLAAMVAGVSVTSPHTIHPDLDRTLLLAYAQSCKMELPAVVQGLLLADVEAP